MNRYRAAARDHEYGRQAHVPLSVASSAGRAGLLVATAAIHLDLYLTGYRTIPTISWLFLLQVIAGFALALAVLVTPLIARSSWVPAAVAAALGAGFAISTLGGYLLSLWVGLFGFREIRTTAGVVAGILEIAAFAVLALLAVASLPAMTQAPEAKHARSASSVRAAGTGRTENGASVPGAANTPADGLPAAASRAPACSRWISRLQDPRLRKAALPTVAGLSVVAIVVFAVSVATANGGGSAPATASGHAVLKTTSVGGVTILTNSDGRALYWFAPDSPTSSACYGTCAAYWPPVYGSPTLAAGVSGVTGKLGTIHRTDGTVQATYDGHPLYTYIADTAPGQVNGNNVNLNGGFWHEMTASGQTQP